MRKNGKTILSKIQDVMGIKNGKYCSSDVSVVSLNNNGGKPQSHTLGDKPEAPINTIGLPSVTYTNCSKKELVTINFNEILMNNNIIPDCVLGGSVTLNDLSGYVVNYGDTICPAPTVKGIRRCGSVERPISIDFGNNVVTDGLVYNLSFNGGTRLGCYTIIGDSPILSEDSVSSVQQVPDCNSCGPIRQTVTQIQSCENGLIYTVSGELPFIKFGDILNLTFKKNIIANGCYTILEMTLSTPLDVISTTSPIYDSCESCSNPTPSPSYSSPTPTPTITPTPTPLFTYVVGSYSEIKACNKPSGTTFVYSSSSFIEVNTTFLYTNQELTIPYYSFGLVNYNTQSGTFTLGTEFDGKVSNLKACV